MLCYILLLLYSHDDNGRLWHPKKTGNLLTEEGFATNRYARDGGAEAQNFELGARTTGGACVACCGWPAMSVACSLAA